MAKCSECGTRYSKGDVANEFESYFDGEVEYDQDDYDGLCADCAIAQAESWEGVGHAIDMMNGDEDYDQDVVDKWL